MDHVIDNEYIDINKIFLGIELSEMLRRKGCGGGDLPPQGGAAGFSPQQSRCGVLPPAGGAVGYSGRQKARPLVAPRLSHGARRSLGPPRAAQLAPAEAVGGLLRDVASAQPGS